MDAQEDNTHILLPSNPQSVPSFNLLLVSDLASYYIKKAKAILRVLVYHLISTGWSYVHAHI